MDPAFTGERVSNGISWQRTMASSLQHGYLPLVGSIKLCLFPYCQSPNEDTYIYELLRTMYSFTRCLIWLRFTSHYSTNKSYETHWYKMRSIFWIGRTIRLPRRIETEGINSVADGGKHLSLQNKWPNCIIHTSTSQTTSSLSVQMTSHDILAFATSYQA